MNHYDVVIIGGGMVGLSLAVSLKQTNLRIAVIEGNLPSPKLSDTPDVRVSALNQASEFYLKNLGVWDLIYQTTPYQGMSVWEKDSFAKIEFNAADILQSHLGHIVENRAIQLALLDKVNQLPNIDLWAPNQCQNLIIGESEAWITLDSGVSMTSKLVVGADGANSWLRQQQDIPLTSWDYGHEAIVGNIQTQEPHQGIARQVFTPDGPIALLPLHQPNLCSLVWSTTPSFAQNLVQQTQDESTRHLFNQKLNVDFDYKLGECRLIGECQSFPLKMRYARDFAAQRIVLVGDAAHTIHPLAGQGVNLGFLDAASLSQEIVKLWQNNEDFGLVSNLRHYERWRKAQATQMILAMQGFKDLFSGDNEIKKLMRGVGMNLFAQLPGMKKFVMKQAMEGTGEIPELCKYQNIKV